LRENGYGKRGEKKDNYDEENTYIKEGALIIGQL
jgi:hypothetical protein